MITCDLCGQSPACTHYIFNLTNTLHSKDKNITTHGGDLCSDCEKQFKNYYRLSDLFRMIAEKLSCKIGGTP